MFGDCVEPWLWLRARCRRRLGRPYRGSPRRRPPGRGRHADGRLLDGRLLACWLRCRLRRWWWWRWGRRGPDRRSRLTGLWRRRLRRWDPDRRSRLTGLWRRRRRRWDPDRRSRLTGRWRRRRRRWDPPPKGIHLSWQAAVATNRRQKHRPKGLLFVQSLSIKVIRFFGTGFDLLWVMVTGPLRKQVLLRRARKVLAEFYQGELQNRPPAGRRPAGSRCCGFP